MDSCVAVDDIKTELKEEKKSIVPLWIKADKDEKDLPILTLVKKEEIDWFVAVEDIKTEFKKEEIKIPVPSWMEIDNDEKDPLAHTTVKKEDSFEDLKPIIHDPDLSDVEDDLKGDLCLPSHLRNKRVGLQEDDLAADDQPDSESDDGFMYFSDGPSDDYEPRVDDMETSDVEELHAANISEPHATSSQTQEAAPWVNVYPPEPEQEITSKFAVQNVGPQNCPQNGNPLDFFNLFMTTAVWSLMVRETNKNAQAVLCQRHEAGTLRQHSRLTKWVDVTVKEMKKFWAILINMGLTGRKNFENYWDSNFSQTVSFYPKMMSLERFQLIMTMFHLSSNDCPQRGQLGYDPWMKIRDFVNMMTESFKKYFVPGQEVCIDESMIGMKSGCSFIQYRPNKRHANFGIKKFEICDSSTSYILHVSLCSGKDFLAKNIDPFQKVVKELMTQAHCLGKGYHLFVDNYYSKMPLCNFLLSNNTYLTGTVNIESKELSQNVVQAKLAEGQTLYYRKGSTLLVKYREKQARKPVHLLTTACHAEDIVVRRKNGVVRSKPMLIHRYNTFMDRVDKDKSIYNVTCSLPCEKYWRKIVFNFVDIAIFNAWILFKAQNPKHKRWHDFIVEIVEQLCFESAVVDPVPGSRHPLATLPPSTSTSSLTPSTSTSNLAPSTSTSSLTPSTSTSSLTPSTSTSSLTPSTYTSILKPSTYTSILKPSSSHMLTKLPGKGQCRLCTVCNKNRGIKSRSRFWCPPCNTGVHRECFALLKHFCRPRKSRTSKLPNQQ